MSNQGLKQASIRAVTSTTGTYEEDWHALFDLAGIASGVFNGRLLGYINHKLSSSYDNLPSAMHAFAADNGAYNWDSLGTFDASEGLLDGFESISGTLAAYTSSGYVWTQSAAQGSGLGITTSGSNVTQGSFSWRWQGTSIDSGFSGWGYNTTSDFITGVNLTGFNTIELDVFGATVPAGLKVTLYIEDLTDYTSAQDQTALGFSGADTLLVDISALTPTQKANCNIKLSIDNNGGAATSALDFYIDNLRGS